MHTYMATPLARRADFQSKYILFTHGGTFTMPTTYSEIDASHVSARVDGWWNYADGFTQLLEYGYHDSFQAFVSSMQRSFPKES